MAFESVIKLGLLRNALQKLFGKELFVIWFLSNFMVVLFCVLAVSCAFYSCVAVFL